MCCILGTCSLSLLALVSFVRDCKCFYMFGFLWFLPLFLSSFISWGACESWKHSFNFNFSLQSFCLFWSATIPFLQYYFICISAWFFLVEIVWELHSLFCSLFSCNFNYEILKCYSLGELALNSLTKMCRKVYGFNHLIYAWRTIIPNHNRLCLFDIYSHHIDVR